MSVQTEINRISSEVSDQTALIEQIQTALAGKAAGGGGTTVETCTVTVTFCDEDDFVTYTTFADGAFGVNVYNAADAMSCTLENVVCNTSITYIRQCYSGVETSSVTGSVVLVDTEFYQTSLLMLFTCTDSDGGDITITVNSGGF